MDYGQVIYFASQTYSDSQINYGKCKSILTKNVKKAEATYEKDMKKINNLKALLKTILKLRKYM